MTQVNCQICDLSHETWITQYKKNIMKLNFQYQSNVEKENRLQKDQKKF